MRRKYAGTQCTFMYLAPETRARVSVYGAIGDQEG